MESAFEWNVVDVAFAGGYVLRVTFADGKVKDFDMSNYLHFEIYKPLSEQRVFESAFVDYGTVVWPCGADIAPETLYELGREVRSPS